MTSLSPDRERAVRTEVRRLLERSEAFARLPSEERRRLARNLVKVGSYLADPGWLAALPPAEAAVDTHEGTQALSELRDHIEQRAPATVQAAELVAKRLAEKPGQVGAEFEAGAVREGVRAFTDLVEAVDFPEFVSGLVQGVFQAIVDASIQQMEAYGEMLSAVAKSVEQFAQDHIPDAQARDFIANKNPTRVVVVSTSEGARLRANPDSDDADAVGAQLGVPNADLSEPEGELALVNAAKLEMARQRQQMLATMVLLGINRIVVTNGRINAKVVFDMKASDQASRRARASMFDEKQTSTAMAAAAWSPWGAAGASRTSKHRTTVKSSVDDDSESKAEVKAQLTGEVRINFRSETFPLDKIADAGGLSMLQQRAQPLPIPGQAPAATPTPTTPPRT